MRQTHACSFCLLLTFLMLPPASAQLSAPSTGVPQDNLSYPVLVTLSGGGIASGFYLNTPAALYFVTARHLLFRAATADLVTPSADCLSYSNDPARQETNQLNLNLPTLLASGNLKRHATNDIVVARLAVFTPGDKAIRYQFVPGVRATKLAENGPVAVVPPAIKRFKDVVVSNDVFLFGYPTSLGLASRPQFDHRRPLLRKGIVAGTDPESRTILLDCPVYQGNSGGPVIEVDRFPDHTEWRVIGVVSEFVPWTETWLNQRHGYTNTTIANSGYSVAVAMDPVLELLDAFEQSKP